MQFIYTLLSGMSAAEYSRSSITGHLNLVYSEYDILELLIANKFLIAVTPAIPALATAALRLTPQLD
jgi:hypothetical protein